MFNIMLTFLAEQAPAAAGAAAEAVQQTGEWGIFGLAIAAGIAISLTGLATALVQKDVGSAAVGAMAENEKLFVKGLVLTALPETVVLFGFVIAIILCGKILIAG